MYFAAPATGISICIFAITLDSSVATCEDVTVWTGPGPLAWQSQLTSQSAHFMSHAVPDALQAPSKGFNTCGLIEAGPTGPAQKIP